MPEPFTEEWSRACCARLNAHAPYAEAAAGWQGAVVLVMTADAAHGVDAPRAVHLDLSDGRCHGVRAATEADLAEAPYVLEADPATWKRLLAGEMEPVAAVMRGALRLTRGGLFALAKYAGAAREMVAAAGQVPAAWPAAAG